MPLHLLVKWEVVRFLQIVDIGNFNMRLEILKSSPSLTGYGRWFLQIVDIHVGNFNMKLTGR